MLKNIVGLFFIFCVSFNAIASEEEQLLMFETCKQTLQEKAQKEGFSTYITNDIIQNLQPLKRVISLDKKQPEFSESFSRYINLRVNKFRVNKGRDKLKENKLLLDKLFKQYGIAPQYLMSFWGLETNFGKHKGKMSVLNSVATLACDKRRSDYFTQELFELFTLIDEKKVSIEQLQGSWAGAMGHMQFMPTALRKYAIDSNNDGKIDVWNNEVDALTSAANYLKQIGWKSGERWGRAVKLPANFKFEQIEFDKTYPLSTFASLGVTQLNGKPLPNVKIKAELVLPAGHKGPAFVVYNNFNVIMQWNNSKNYALAVGMLADRIGGTPPLNVTSSNKTNFYTRTQMKALQSQLSLAGFDVGKPDGIWGPKSRKAIRQFQLNNGLIADGYPNKTVFEAVNIEI